MSADGQPVGGIVGFLNDLRRITELFRPQNVVVAWEGGGSARRRQIYPEYKQHRRPQRLNRFYADDIPDTFNGRNDQVENLVKLLRNLPVCQIFVPDCEADDVIAYLSRYRYRDARRVILSSDRDFYQLLDVDTVTIYSPTWKRVVKSAEVIEKFGIAPVNFALAKAVCGDPSDNVPGIRGVGFKTLASTFPRFREDATILLEDFLHDVDVVAAEKRKSKTLQNMQQGKDVIRRNWKLVQLDMSGLSGTQIKCIDDAVDTFQPAHAKIRFTRELLQIGIRTFNVDNLFLTFNYIQ